MIMECVTATFLVQTVLGYFIEKGFDIAINGVKKFINKDKFEKDFKKYCENYYNSEKYQNINFADRFLLQEVNKDLSKEMNNLLDIIIKSEHKENDKKDFIEKFANREKYQNDENLKEYLNYIYDFLNNYFFDELTKSEKFILTTIEDKINKVLDEIAQLKTIYGNSNLKIRKKSISPITEDEFYLKRNGLTEKIHNKFNNKNIVYLQSKVGGIGKSELAREYAQEYKQYYDTISHIVYENSLFATIKNLDCNGTLQNDKDENAIFNEKLSLLLNASNETLLIIDNFDVFDNSPKNTPPLPNEVILRMLKDCNIKILFTTRNQRRGGIDVPQFSDEELIEIFKKNNNTITDENTIKKIIEIVGRHTLLLVLSAKLLDDNEELTEKFLNYSWTSISTKVEHMEDEKSINEFILQLFDFTQITPLQIYIMKNMCLVPLAGIDKSIFIKFVNLAEENYHTLNHLINGSWILKDKNTISLHPVIKTAFCQKDKVSTTDCKEFINSLTDETDKQIGYPQYSEAKPYIDIALSTAEFFENSEEKTKNVAELFIGISKCIDKFAFYNDEERLLNKAIIILGNNVNNKKLLATTYNDLGGAYYGMGEIDKAIEYLEKALEIRKKVLPENHPDIATTYNNLGSVYKDKGEIDKAIEYYNKALEIRKKVLPENHPDLAKTYGNLGGVYKDKGEIDKAIEYYNKALEIFKKVLPENHPDLATTYNNLGSVYKDKGEIDKAIEYYNKALEIFKKVLPENHPDIAATYNNLGGVYQYKGEIDKTIEYYNKALKIKEKVLPENHPSLATTYNNLGGAYYGMGDLDKAIEYLEKALEISKKVLPENHPYLATTYNNLGLVYQNKGEIDKAIEYLEKALKINKISLPSTHPSTKSVYFKIINVFEEMKKPDEVIKYKNEMKEFCQMSDEEFEKLFE